MLSFEITRSTVAEPVRCTITGAYSGVRCRELGTVALDVVARYADERGDVPYRSYRLCPSDAERFVAGYRESAGAPVEIIDE